MNGNLDLYYMGLAINEAQKAAEEGEVPVGAVMVRRGEVIATAHNQREGLADATAHAELLVIRRACQTLGGWHLTDCTLYVTLEPCPMCAGAIINARVDRVVFGAYDGKFGAMGSLVDLPAHPFNHRPIVEGGVMEEQNAALLKTFFKRLRAKEAARKQQAEEKEGKQEG